MTVIEVMGDVAPESEDEAAVVDAHSRCAARSNPSKNGTPCSSSYKVSARTLHILVDH